MAERMKFINNMCLLYFLFILFIWMDLEDKLNMNEHLI